MAKFSFFFGLCFLLGNLKQTRTTVLFKSTVIRNFYGSMAPDRFSLPVAVCNSSVKCEHYGGATDNNNKCLCVCPTTKPTIRLFNGKWNCINDKRIRKNEGCKILFDGETTKDPISTLNNSKVLDLKGRCSINVQKSTEIACSGKRRSLVNFDVDRIHVDDKLPNKLTLWITEAFAFALPHYRIDGKVIRLELNCTNPKKTDCLLFKVRGKTECRMGTNNEDPASHDTKTTPSRKPTISSQILKETEALTRPITLEPKATVSSTKNSIMQNTSHVNVEKNSVDGDDWEVMPVGFGVSVVCVVLIIVTAAMVVHCYKKRRDFTTNSALSVDLASGIDSSSNYNENNIYAEIGELPNQKTTTAPSDGGYASLKRDIGEKEDLSNGTLKANGNSSQNPYQSLNAAKCPCNDYQELPSKTKDPEYRVLEGADPKYSSVKK